MSNWLVIVVTVLYAWTSVDHFQHGHVGFCIMFGAYALANIGLLLASNGG